MLKYKGDNFEEDSGGIWGADDEEWMKEDDFGWFTREAAPQPYVRSTPKIGRNDPCPCGSGKKYKKCCGK